MIPTSEKSQATEGMEITMDVQSINSDDVGLTTSNWHKFIHFRKVNLFKQSWFPPSDCDWPCTESRNEQKVRYEYLGPQHLTDS